MAKLKVFALGQHGIVGAAVLRALGEPTHMQTQRQARVLIVAASKVAAIQLTQERRAYATPPSPSDPQFREATGIDVDALLTAGLCDEPAVLVLPLSSRRCPVVRVDVDGVRRVGTLDGNRFAAEPWNEEG